MEKYNRELRRQIEAARPQPIKPGDQIKVRALVATVDVILYQDCYIDVDEQHPNGHWLWDVEFLDPQQHYHHWKQYFDAGEVISNEA